MAPTPWYKKPSYIIPFARCMRENFIFEFSLAERKLNCAHMVLDMKKYKN